MRKLMFALAIVAGAFMIADSAMADSYAMHNYGRFHGYLNWTPPLTDTRLCRGQRHATHSLTATGGLVACSSSL